MAFYSQLSLEKIVNLATCIYALNCHLDISTFFLAIYNTNYYCKLKFHFLEARSTSNIDRIYTLTKCTIMTVCDMIPPLPFSDLSHYWIFYRLCIVCSSYARGRSALVERVPRHGPSEHVWLSVFLVLIECVRATANNAKR